MPASATTARRCARLLAREGGALAALLGCVAVVAWSLSGGVGCKGEATAPAVDVLDASLDGGRSVVCTDAGTQPWRKNQVPAELTQGPGGERINFFDVWAATDRAVWIVGSGGTVLFYDGAAWVRQDTPTATTLTAVWGTSARDVWATGFAATVLHFDGTRWSEAAPPTTLFVQDDGGVPAGDAGTALRPNLWGVWATGQADRTTALYAVGDRGAIVYWTPERQWQVVASGVQEDLSAVWGANTNSVFVVGDFGTVLAGSQAGFSKQQTGVSKALRGVWGHGANDVYAVGVNGVLLHSGGGGSWVPVEGAPKQVLRGVWGPENDRGTIYISGWDGLLLKVTGGPSYGAGAAFELFPCVTPNRLEGIHGVLVDAALPDAAPSDGGVAPMPAPVPAIWVVGVSGTVIIGP